MNRRKMHILDAGNIQVSLGLLDGEKLEFVVPIGGGEKMKDHD